MSIHRIRNATIAFAGAAALSGFLYPPATARAENKTVTGVTAESQAMTGAYAGAETETLRQIREDIVAKDSFSTQAKNVKIVVAKDLITFRGAVASPAERAEIIRIAKAVAPKYRIENRMTASN